MEHNLYFGEKSIESKINKEYDHNGENMVRWGIDNLYPQHLQYLYDYSPSLASLINGTVNMIASSEFKLHESLKDPNDKQSYEDLIKKIVLDYLIYGGFALEVLPRRGNQYLPDVNYLDFSKVRSSKSNNTLYYSDDFRYSKGIDMEAFNEKWVNSILYYKGLSNYTYPKPLYHAVIKAIEAEIGIYDYVQGNISNGFASNMIIEFTNVNYTDEQKRQITDKITDKFSGSRNSGKIMTTFTANNESDVHVSKLDNDESEDKYLNQADRLEKTIYASFGADKTLFGLPKESSGFNATEYEHIYSLYEKNMLTPIKKMITETFDRIYKIEESIVWL